MNATTFLTFLSKRLDICELDVGNETELLSNVWITTVQDHGPMLLNC